MTRCRPSSPQNLIDGLQIRWVALNRDELDVSWPGMQNAKVLSRMQRRTQSAAFPAARRSAAAPVGSCARTGRSCGPADRGCLRSTAPSGTVNSAWVAKDKGARKPRLAPSSKAPSKPSVTRPCPFQLASSQRNRAPRFLPREEEVCSAASSFAQTVARNISAISSAEVEHGYTVLLAMAFFQIRRISCFTPHVALHTRLNTSAGHVCLRACRLPSRWRQCPSSLLGRCPAAFARRPPHSSGPCHARQRALNLQTRKLGSACLTHGLQAAQSRTQHPAAQRSGSTGVRAPQ